MVTVVMEALEGTAEGTVQGTAQVTTEVATLQVIMVTTAEELSITMEDILGPQLQGRRLINEVRVWGKIKAAVRFSNLVVIS